jgi:hypothetical protein
MKKNNHVFVTGSQKAYIWLSSKTGIISTTSEKCPVTNGSAKCLGYTFEIGYPKRLNTGRIIYKNTNSKKWNKQFKKRKKLGVI